MENVDNLRTIRLLKTLLVNRVRLRIIISKLQMSNKYPQMEAIISRIEGKEAISRESLIDNRTITLDINNGCIRITSAL